MTKLFIVGERVEVCINTIDKTEPDVTWAYRWFAARYASDELVERKNGKVYHLVDLDRDDDTRPETDSERLLRRRTIADAAIRRPERWRCHAKPAALGGRTCGAENDTTTTIHHGTNRMQCCGACGATRVASIHREIKG